ncbi:Protein DETOXIFICATION 43 [Vigna angularis]|uniref:Protein DETOXIFICATION n=1 Tax=Phaseolus angularis TaxID=3914 RepID=A0A8T0JKN1_PHAAN|nr:Protein DETOXIFICATION 43 [Vigna angularis]
MDENGSSSNEPKNNNRNLPVSVFFKDARHVFKMDSIAKEILGIAFPSALAVAADPIASLIDTAFIGHLGPVELAAAGVSIALFNQASRITIFPLVSITTSFVAEENTIEKMNKEKNLTENIKAKSKEVRPEDQLIQDIEKGASKEHNETPTESSSSTSENVEMDDCNTSVSKSTSAGSSSSNKSVSKPGRKKRHVASASTALLFGTILGLLQAATLIFAAKPLLAAMGLKPVFSGYALNVALDPVLIFYCKMGIKGAAISHVLSQYVMAFALLLILTRKVDLVPPSIKDLQIFRFLKNGGLLLARVVAVTFCQTLAASLAARFGPIPMAAFQTCLQVWLTSSLLADGLAVAVQAILACSFAEKDYEKVIAAATRTLQMSFVLGVGLSLAVGVGLYFGAGIFSKSVLVVHLIRIGLPFVAATQPINSLAFVFDGVNYGASDFAYSAYSLVTVSLASVASLFLLSKSKGFVGLWIALTIYMSLRMFAGDGNRNRTMAFSERTTLNDVLMMQSNKRNWEENDVV